MARIVRVVGLLVSAIFRWPGRVLRALEKRGHDNVMLQFHRLDREEAEAEEERWNEGRR